MNKIFIEAQGQKTPEYNFLKAFLDKHFYGKRTDFVCTAGIGNLFNESNLNQMRLSNEEGEQVLILIDADTVGKGGGFAKRQAYMNENLCKFNLSFIPYFIYPNHQDEGEVETLMESACCELHPDFFHCFNCYERCVGRKKDSSGKQLYNTPNLKGKLHTYINAQQLIKKQRYKLGSGDWLFDNSLFWDLDADALHPLKSFFGANLK